ncbi:MAG: helix-turn-helix domain-containing protein [Sneathiella sp.]
MKEHVKNWLMTAQPRFANDYVVLKYLASYADTENCCTTTLSCLSASTQLSITDAMYSLGELHAYGLIKLVYPRSSSLHTSSLDDDVEAQLMVTPATTQVDNKHALNWAYSIKTGNPCCKAVLTTLALWADERYSCAPTVEKIADQSELSERTVRSWIKWLNDNGIITIENQYVDGRQIESRYWLNIPKSGGVE